MKTTDLIKGKVYYFKDKKQSPSVKVKFLQETNFLKKTGEKYFKFELNHVSGLNNKILLDKKGVESKINPIKKVTKEFNHFDSNVKNILIQSEKINSKVFGMLRAENWYNKIPKYASSDDFIICSWFDFGYKGKPIIEGKTTLGIFENYKDALTFFKIKENKAPESMGDLNLDGEIDHAKWMVQSAKSTLKNLIEQRKNLDLKNKLKL